MKVLFFFLMSQVAIASLSRELVFFTGIFCFKNTSSGTGAASNSNEL